MADPVGWLIPSAPWDERFPINPTTWHQVSKIPVYAREDGTLTVIKPGSDDFMGLSVESQGE